MRLKLQFKIRNCGYKCYV